MDRVLRNRRLRRARTSLDRAEFVRLEMGLETLLTVQRLDCRHDGLPRQRAFGAGGEASKLPTTAAKLLFILFYFKCYPLQEAMGLLLGMSQPQSCEWIKRLTPLVNLVLGREWLLPARRPAGLDHLLEAVPALRILVLDGVERPVRRPKDKDGQKRNYSGQKKAHRKKNRLLSSEKRVVDLGPASPGSVQDKKLADESGLFFPPGALVVKDTGFQGYEPPDTDTRQPKKKPRGRELHPIQKTINQVISLVRVTVEHAICGHQTLSRRLGPLPQPAQGVRGRSHARCQRPTSLAGSHSHRLNAPTLRPPNLGIPLDTTPYKVYCSPARGCLVR